MLYAYNVEYVIMVDFILLCFEKLHILSRTHTHTHIHTHTYTHTHTHTYTHTHYRVKISPEELSISSLENCVVNKLAIKDIC